VADHFFDIRGSLIREIGVRVAACTLWPAVVVAFHFYVRPPATPLTLRRRLTGLDVVLVAYTFFGIEEIGVEIEGSFGHDENDLLLEEICATIQRNVYEFAGMERPPHALSVRDATQ